MRIVRAVVLCIIKMERALKSEMIECMCTRCLFQSCHGRAGVVYFKFEIANCVGGGDEPVVILVHLGTAIVAYEVRLPGLQQTQHTHEELTSRCMSAFKLFMSEDIPLEDERSLSRRVCFSRSARYLQRPERVMTCLP